MSAWDSVARNLISSGEFDRPKFDGKKTQARFAIMLRDHQDRNETSAKASGAAEECIERRILLDDLLAQVLQVNEEGEKRTAEEEAAAAQVESSAAQIRDEAMKSQGKRKAKGFDDESASTGGGKMLKEREFQAEERNKDREIQAQLIQMLQTTMTALLSALVKKL
ncbi:hypothetical protein H310_03294 [Aphanomyces invadans]|uniref:Uncharacterized protein n=1 Tax=Aphanomyces invadans TaxID=157072 RepID=A0A024UI49_9STRA|nr:hypothetical protein H310_03294 [Aphanomyces invadans]ETW05542.1 hypothetical protein H310_03294 [Aphanomyces invadans]|eukprot:XP_008865319.1 hypothetical protein H310_03294 [Aphanomyces invadans]